MNFLNSFKSIWTYFYQVDDSEGHLTKRSGNDYLLAQQDGHYNQDCSEYEAACPDSFFGVSFSVICKNVNLVS